MKHKNIKHIFFDLDHTLWDFNKNSDLAFKQIFSEYQIAVNFNDFKNSYNPINEKYWKLYREDKISKSDLRYGRLKDSFDSVHYTISDELIHQLSNDYLIALTNYNYLMEGCFDILDYLHPKYKLHIITNGFKEVQLNKLKQTKIDSYFDVIVTSESVGVKKPNPKVFEFALNESKAKADESVMIGDSFEADVLGAFQVGMHPVYFTEQHDSNIDKFLSIKNLTDLKQYL